MKKILLIAGLALAPMVANAALPPEAYAGDFWERQKGGASCIVDTIHNPSQIVLPQSFGNFAAPGTYVYWDNVAKKCVQGGRAYGPQF